MTLGAEWKALPDQAKALYSVKAADPPPVRVPASAGGSAPSSAASDALLDEKNKVCLPVALHVESVWCALYSLTGSHHTSGSYIPRQVHEVGKNSGRLEKGACCSNFQQGSAAPQGDQRSQGGFMSIPACINCRSCSTACFHVTQTHLTNRQLCNLKRAERMNWRLQWGGWKRMSRFSRWPPLACALVDECMLPVYTPCCLLCALRI